MVSQNSPPPNDDSGLSVSLRLSGTLIASILSFSSGYVVAYASNKQMQTQTQNVNCPSQNSTLEHQSNTKDN